MRSQYLNNLSIQEKESLRDKLWKTQSHKCFICGKDIDLVIQKGALDIDHIKPLKLGGKDHPNNFALTHSSCNRSKQASDLRIARVMAIFDNISAKSLTVNNRTPNLSDIFEVYGGSKHKFTFSINDDLIEYSFPDVGKNEIIKSRIYKDNLSDFQFFFTIFPIQYLYHDDRINPRSIGRNISKLLTEFYNERPQLHISLGYIFSKDNSSEVKIFDGQHKAAAQVLLGTKELPVRVFIDPDLDTLLTTNTNAGTTLRQVAFDKSVQRHLGSQLYIDRVNNYKRDLGLSEDNFNFSEADLVKYFKGESREMKRYILDSIRNDITHNPDNELRDFIDFGGRKKESPLSYSSIEKTFYSFFIYQKLLDTPIDFRLEDGENPRQLEKEQILRLMNIIAEEIYIGKYEPVIGTHRIEYKIQKGEEEIPEDHLIAFRMSREEIMYNWLKYIKQIISNFFSMQGKPITEERLFQYKFTEPLFDILRIFIRNLRDLKLWVDHELSKTVFGGKQNYQYWQMVFENTITSNRCQFS
ncbi:MAG: HNH endonuclease [Candidatus Odinarchaeota archaeon]